jgi:hypothetical protein
MSRELARLWRVVYRVEETWTWQGRGLATSSAVRGTRMFEVKDWRDCSMMGILGEGEQGAR